jgi:uncharacterized protein DUF2867
VEEIPWREKLSPARLMDTHLVHLEGGPDAPQIHHLEELLLKGDPSGLAWPARLLFSLRDWLGKVFAWDAKESPKIDIDSYYWKMTEQERVACHKEPGQREGPAVVLWNDRYSLCLEVLNATCHAFAVGFIRDRKAYLSVFVIETKWWSKYYLALIEPFRKYVVYPAGVKWVTKCWREKYN